MDSDSHNKHKFIKLIEYALSNKSFSVREACDASGLSEREFDRAKYSLFVLLGKHEHVESPHERLDWWLKPEAYFSYISYLEFQHSLNTSRRAHWIAVFSLLIASASLLVSAYGAFFK